MSTPDLWEEVSNRLREMLDETTYDGWLAGAALRELGGELVVVVPNEFRRAWIERHFLETIETAVCDLLGSKRTVRLAVGENEREPGDLVERPTDPAAAVESPPTRRLDGLNPRYSFEHFVVGSCNRFAHAAALAVAEAPGQRYNPLFLYGKTGLGKTHLLQATAAHAGASGHRLSVCYLTSERFLNEFIDALRDKRIDDFKRRYRHCDLLLVDDIQFFADKERIQEEFFHTFNSLHNAGSQIVISSDRPAKEIATLEARLRSRFEGGLITELGLPDLETRIAILHKKVQTEKMPVPDPEVLTAIAGRVSTDIRELEGAFTRVVAFARLSGWPLTVELAEEVLKDVFPPSERAAISVGRIQDVVADRFAISLAELTGQRRTRALVYPRQLAMYLSREMTDGSLPRIGREFGGRDHTTVIHATTKIGRLVREDRGAAELVEDLTARIKQVE